MITSNDIKKLAHLSAIEVLDEEIEDLIHHIKSVLEYASRVEHIAQLNQEPLSAGENVTREDQEHATQNEQLCKAFPQSAQNFIVVPRIIEG